MKRRQFLLLSAATLSSMLIAPRIAFAQAETDRRFIFIIQRGAADGLNTVVPYADPAYSTLRGALAVEDSVKLNGMFALNPALGELNQFYKEQQALFVHAIASPYRARSHFDGQYVLESGGTSPYELRDGWLNRLVGMLPKSRGEAIAFAPTIPLALRGPADTTSFAPSALPDASDDLIMRVSRLYESDEQLHPLWSAAMEAQAIGGQEEAGRGAVNTGRNAANFLVQPDGPRIAMIETIGWDTHRNQNTRLVSRLGALDKLIGTLRNGLGDVWNSTTVLVATEFGRTAAVNGTGGTDHGTASAAMLVGGAVRGGRVLADWPGLNNSALYEGRDLAPTLDLDLLIAVAAAETFNLDSQEVMRTLFPGGRFSSAVSGVVRS